MTGLPEKVRVILEFLTLAICIVTFAFTSMGVFASLLGSDGPGSRDFVEYWAAGHQLAHHANPYDSDAILKLERSAGFPSGIPTLVMGNPPSALLLVLPLGRLSAMTAELVWEFLLLASLVLSVQLLRTLYGSQENLLHVLAYAFAPALSCLLAGQISLFILLGLVLFLRWNRSRPFLAGASLWLCLLKPQLFLPFGIVLLVWIILTRSYKIVAGAACALGISSALATMFDPLVWSQYAQMMSAARIDKILMPCIGSLLRFYVPPHTFWLQCLPAGIASLWALAFFLKKRDKWSWPADGSLLMLVSVSVAPYTWFMDQAVLIPALLWGVYSTRSRNLIALLALMSAVIEIEILRGLPLLHSFYYIWTAPAFLVWYLFAVRQADAIRAHGLTDGGGHALET